MNRRTVSYAIILSILSAACWAGDLESLCQKLPENTFCFAATAGYDNFKDDFDGSTMGRIAADPQVKTFFDQLIASVSRAKDFPEIGVEGQVYTDFVRGLLRSPTVLALSATTDKMSDEPCVVLISEPIDTQDSLGKLFNQMLEAELAAEEIVKKQVHGADIYVSNDPNSCTPYYVAPTGDCFMIAINDDNFAMLKNLSGNAYNAQLADTLSSVPSANEMMVIYVDCNKFTQIMQEEAPTDTDAQEVLQVMDTLGMTDIGGYLIKCGFEGKNLVMDGKIETSMSASLWDAVGPVDKSVFDMVDPKAMQATAMYIDPSQLYDMIMTCVTSVSASEDVDPKAEIAKAEEMVGFKIREDFLSSLDGTFMAYMLPPYSSPELLTGGGVLTAQLKDAEKFKNCMQSLETLITSLAPADQIQISSQKTADDKEVHIWAVGLMAMMQVIPSWAIEGDTLIVTSHPNVTKKMIQRIASPGDPSLMSSTEFSAAAARIPGDAFMMSLTDSKTQARQFMKMLQQYWPMLNMGLAEQGVQLPIMLPSIEPYIEQMAPGLSYTRKVADGIEFHYEGTGLEATSGGAAGGAMGMAILMPALSKTKKISQRVVSGTNLKGIGTCCVVYANDHDDEFPSDFIVLVEEYDLSIDSLESPRMPNNFDGPSYILIQGLTGAASANTVLAYENPVFCNDGKVNVLYCDGHVSAESKESLKQDLQKTYEYLKKTVPQLDW